MIVKDVFKIIGEKLIPGFSLDDPMMEQAYSSVFDVFKEGISKEHGKRAKGCMLIGSKGVGKSACMRTMNVFFRDTERVFQYSKGADILKALDYKKPSEILFDFGYELKRDLYIDDIGLAQSVKNDYGNKINIMSELLIERYDLFVSEGYKTHLSTNRFFNVDREKMPDIPTTIMEMYGDVVCDRIIEMNKFIIWQGESLRK